MDQQRQTLVITPAPAAEPRVGRWLGALEDARFRTKRLLSEHAPLDLDRPAPGGNAIGTILAHVAAIEMDWLYAEILEREFPPEVVELLPPRVRDDNGRLLIVGGESLDQHLARLDATRAILIRELSLMTLDDFLRVRSLEPYDVTPEWVLHHLAQHEAEHRSEIERAAQATDAI
jgi:hypothetical protein